MPELPEAETIARDLDDLLTGRSIESVKVLRPDVLRGTTARTLSRRLPGARIERTWRRAKAVVVDLSTGDRLVVVPRFTGTLQVDSVGPQPEQRYVAIRFVMSDGGAFEYRDVRRLGTVSLLSAGAFAQFDRRLGVEPLDESFSVPRIAGLLRTSRQAVKKVLMDQRRFAGVGNIYANESLWLARIDPSRRATMLDLADVENLRDAVVKVLRAAIDARGTTFRDYRDARGQRGGFADSLAVYERAGAPCRRCGTRVVMTHAVDGRSTYFCFRCQR
jgi:formamidopyrimidine-DNA glycosylase